MSTLGTLKDANQLASQKHVVTLAINEPVNVLLLHHLLNRGEATITMLCDELDLTVEGVKSCLIELIDAGLIKQENDTYALEDSARLRFGHSAYSMDSLINQTIGGSDNNVSHALPGTYLIVERIGRGATSVTFKAKQADTHAYRTLKIFVPGTIDHTRLDAALEKRSRLTDEALPEIIEAGEIAITLIKGVTLNCLCVVMKYIEGDTYSAFLKRQETLDQNVIDRFVERVGGALAAIEAVGLHHGDLHERNILVSEKRTDFWVIDFIGVPSSSSKELYVLSDLENFRNHLMRIALRACQLYPGVSAQTLIGRRSFRVLQGLRQNSYKNFAELLVDFNRDDQKIPSDHFLISNEKPFAWLRVEQISDPVLLYKLFEPAQSRFDVISRFGNTWITGAAGSGKSHYLRVLEFHPKAIIASEEDEETATQLKAMHYDYRKAFGILFPCRLGEFRVFSPEVLGQSSFDVGTQGFLKYILVLKIWNRTLITIRRGLDFVCPKTNATFLQMPSMVQMEALLNFFQERIGKIETVGERTAATLFHRCMATSAAAETVAIAAWSDPLGRQRLKVPRLLDEVDLDSFFAVLQETFQELKQSRFFILVDDVSYGHINLEMQKILNSFLRSSQSRHCFKITCDRYMYTLETSDGRTLMPGVDGTHVDLAEVSAKTSRGGQVQFSKYMAAVVNRRLKYAGYNSDVIKLFGASQPVKEFLAALALPRKRSNGINSSKKNSKRPKAFYAGWNIISNISHGSVRTLLELLEYVFNVNNVTITTETINLQAQDDAVRSYSERRYRSLAMLPGEINSQPLGEALQNVIAAIGEVSRRYLQNYNTGEEGRWYETITVERLDRRSLDSRAETILTKLIEFNLFIDEGITFSRAQLGLSQRYDMNKIFSPAFETTYRVRNHMYLSHRQFATLLLRPDEFVAKHRKKLATLVLKSGEGLESDLFDNSEN